MKKARSKALKRNEFGYTCLLLAYEKVKNGVIMLHNFDNLLFIDSMKRDLILNIFQQVLQIKQIMNLLYIDLINIILPML